LRHIRHWISRKRFGIELLGSKRPPTKNMAYGESNGHVTDDVTSPWKVKVMTPMLRVQYLEISWRCYLATIENYYAVIDALRSAVLATACPLVCIIDNNHVNVIDRRHCRKYVYVSLSTRPGVYYASVSNIHCLHCRPCWNVLISWPRDTDIRFAVGCGPRLTSPRSWCWHIILVAALGVELDACFDEPSMFSIFSFIVFWYYQTTKVTPER